MNLTLHIAIKDFYRLRWALLLWVVAIASELALASIQATLDVEGHVPFYMAAWTFGNIFIPVIGYGLVMGLQDDDPVTEGDAFWMTRPITGGRLLSAKALVLALLCLVPVLVCVPFWLSHDFGLALLGRSSAEVLWRQVLISLLAVPLAVVSSSGGKFVTNTLIGAVTLLGLALLYRLLGGSSPSEIAAPVLVQRGWLILAVWLIASAAIALNQYYRRRTKLSATILVAAVIACFAISKWWSRSGAFPAAPVEHHLPAPQLTEVAVRGGAKVVLDGRTLRVLSVIPDFSRQDRDRGERVGARRRQRIPTVPRRGGGRYFGPGTLPARKPGRWQGHDGRSGAQTRGAACGGAALFSHDACLQSVEGPLRRGPDEHGSVA